MATIDAESDYVINDSSAGIRANTNILTRAASSSPTAIDAVVAAMNDIWVGTSYARADLVTVFERRQTPTKARSLADER